MRPCCREEARRHLRKHRDVARCDRCGALLLAYGNERDFRAMVAELDRLGLPYQADSLGTLRVVAKPPS